MKEIVKAMDNNAAVKKIIAWKRFQKSWIVLCAIEEVLIFTAMAACDAYGYTEAARWLFILMFPALYAYAWVWAAIPKRIQELEDINRRSSISKRQMKENVMIDLTKDRKATTKWISDHLEVFLNPHLDPRIYTAREVTFDYSSGNSVRVDFMKFVPVNATPGGIEQGLVYCYEVKSCKDDFVSGHGLNALGDYNYLVTTPEFAKELMDSRTAEAFYWGIYTCDKYGHIECVKKAKRKVRKRPISEIVLMMYRSSNRELIKYKKEEMQETETRKEGE